MSTMQTWQTKSSSLDNTLELAGKVGRKVQGGERIELISDVGGGKTTFVRGLATGMGSKDTVRSPSFTLTNQYKAGPLMLYHFDFYRLNEPGIMKNELAEVLADRKAVVAVEWAAIVEDVLPTEKLTIRIKAITATIREFSFEYPDSLQYLIPINT